MTAMVWIWLAAAIVFLVIELATVQLATIWFSFGALAALVLELCGVKSLTVQILVFALVSAVTLLATRPLIRKLMDKRKQPTNADRNIGKTAIVTREINNISATGEVSLSGMSWTARSYDGTVIPVGSKVTVTDIEGVKLIVSAMPE